MRLCAAQWANRLFPHSHVQARWACVLACADSKLEVRDEGARGLRLAPATLAPVTAVTASNSNSTGSVTAAGGAADAGMDAAAASGSGSGNGGNSSSGSSNSNAGPPPSLASLLGFARARVVGLMGAPDASRALPLPPRWGFKGGLCMGVDGHGVRVR